MKTEKEIQCLIDLLSMEEPDDEFIFDDVPYIENVRAFIEALNWVLRPSAPNKAIHADGEKQPVDVKPKDRFLTF